MIGLTRKGDAQMHQDVLHELQWDPRVEAMDVGVEVDRGVVTLPPDADADAGDPVLHLHAGHCWTE